MMAFALLVSGWAFAEDPALRITVGNGGDATTTGIYQKMLADWDEGAIPASYWESDNPQVEYTFQLLNDDGTDDGAEVTATYAIDVRLLDENPLSCEFVMDGLKPNRFYKVKATINGVESDWGYFLSAIPKLIPGKLSWDFEETSTGLVNFKLEDYDLSVSREITGPLDDVTAELTVSEVNIAATPVALTDITSQATINADNNAGSIQMMRGTTYRVEGKGVYTYYKGEIIWEGEDSPAGIFPYVQRETEPSKAECEATPFLQGTWQGGTIKPNDIHVGELLSEGQVIGARVTLAVLPGDLPENCMGKLYVKYTDEADEVPEVFAAQIVGSSQKIATFDVLPDDPANRLKTFKFRIEIESKLGVHAALYAMPADCWATASFDDVFPFDIADKHLLYKDYKNGGTKVQAFLMPLDEYVPTESDQFVMTYKVGDNDEVTVYGEQDGTNIKFAIDPQLPENTKFEYMKIAVLDGTQDDEGGNCTSAIIKNKKAGWEYFTCEGMTVTEEGKTFYCEGSVFYGEVKPEAGDNLYYYDWAWTPSTPADITSIEIEYNDSVYTYEVDGETVTYQSQITYVLPTTYNNGQPIKKVTMDQYIKDYNPQPVEADYVYTAIVENPTGEPETHTGEWGKTLVERGYTLAIKNNNGPGYPILSVVKGEKEEGGTQQIRRVFTIASREGHVALGTTLPVCDEEGTLIGVSDVTITGYEGEAIDPIIQRPTYNQNTLTVIPQFYIYNIFNYEYVGKGDNGRAMFSETCDYEIHATLTETKEGGKSWEETTAKGTLTKAGQIQRNSKLLFVEVDGNTEYKLEGYVEYTPVRYTLMEKKYGQKPINEIERGPVVRMSFEYVFTTDQVLDLGLVPDPAVKYYIVDPVEGAPQRYVEARVYDETVRSAELGNLVPEGAQLTIKLLKGDYAFNPITGVQNDDNTVSFFFPVDNDDTTEDILAKYDYEYDAWYQNGDQMGNVIRVRFNEVLGEVDSEDEATFESFAGSAADATQYASGTVEITDSWEETVNPTEAPETFQWYEVKIKTNVAEPGIPVDNDQWLGKTFYISEKYKEGDRWQLLVSGFDTETWETVYEPNGVWVEVSAVKEQIVAPNKDAIHTPAVFHIFNIHDYARDEETGKFVKMNFGMFTYMPVEVGEDEVVSVWELADYAATLNANVFSFTADDVMGNFVNEADYYGAKAAANLVYNYKRRQVIHLEQGTMPLVNYLDLDAIRLLSTTELTQVQITEATVEFTDGANALREGEGEGEGEETPEVVTPAYNGPYAYWVVLEDAAGETAQTVYYCNDVRFMTKNAEYVAKNAGLRRSVVLPFDATAKLGAADATEEAPIYYFSAGYVDDDGMPVFRFSKKRRGGEFVSEVSASQPYIYEGNGTDVYFVGDADEDGWIAVATSESTANIYTTITNSYRPASPIVARYWGVYVPTYDYEVAEPKFEDEWQGWWYTFRYTGAPKSGTSRWAEMKNRGEENVKSGASAFQSVLTISGIDLSGDNAGYSARFRFEGDDDATMIESINVETESNELFDVMGRKVVEPVKGQIYIQNGKKILF